jgi:hypothetical protein
MVSILKLIFSKNPIKSITACASTKSDFIDISLIYWEDFTDLGAAFPVNSAKSLLRQHRAGEKEKATLTTLVAFPSPQCQLFFNVLPSAVNKIKPSKLSHEMDDNIRFFNSLNCSTDVICANHLVTNPTILLQNSSRSKQIK